MFSRYIRKTMIKNTLPYIGLQPNYIEQPYIESNIRKRIWIIFYHHICIFNLLKTSVFVESTPFPGNSSEYIMIEFAPRGYQRFIITEETEQR